MEPTNLPNNQTEHALLAVQHVYVEVHGKPLIMALLKMHIDLILKMGELEQIPDWDPQVILRISKKCLHKLKYRITPFDESLPFIPFPVADLSKLEDLEDLDEAEELPNSMLLSLVPNTRIVFLELGTDEEQAEAASFYRELGNILVLTNYTLDGKTTDIELQIPIKYIELLRLESYK